MMRSDEKTCELLVCDKDKNSSHTEGENTCDCEQMLSSSETSNNSELMKRIVCESETLCQPTNFSELLLGRNHSSETLNELYHGSYRARNVSLDGRCVETRILLPEPVAVSHANETKILAPIEAIAVHKNTAFEKLKPLFTELQKVGQAGKGNQHSNYLSTINVCKTLSEAMDSTGYKEAIVLENNEATKLHSHVIPSVSMAIRDYAIPLEPKRNLVINSLPKKADLKRKPVSKMGAVGKLIKISFVTGEKKSIGLSKGDVYDFDEADEINSQPVLNCNWNSGQGRKKRMAPNLGCGIQSMKTTVQKKNIIEKFNSENMKNLATGLSLIHI